MEQNTPSAVYGLPGCRNCCWHVELGFVGRVDPSTCPGCQIQLICQERRTSEMGIQS